MKGDKIILCHPSRLCHVAFDFFASLSKADEARAEVSHVAYNAACGYAERFRRENPTMSYLGSADSGDSLDGAVTRRRSS